MAESAEVWILVFRELYGKEEFRDWFGLFFSKAMPEEAFFVSGVVLGRGGGLGVFFSNLPFYV